MNGGINPAETTTENDDSFLARLISYRIDHRVLSGETADRNRNFNWAAALLRR
jgi:hypothetical protein